MKYSAIILFAFLMGQIVSVNLNNESESVDESQNLDNLSENQMDNDEEWYPLPKSIEELNALFPCFYPGDESSDNSEDNNSDNNSNDNNEWSSDEWGSDEGYEAMKAKYNENAHLNAYVWNDDTGYTRGDYYHNVSK